MFLWYWLRYLYLYILTLFKKKGQPEDIYLKPQKETAIAWPWLCDWNLHLNTSSQLSETEYSRALLLFSAKMSVRNSQFYWVMGSTMITFRRQIPMFAKYTKIIDFHCYDDKFFYYRQIFIYKGKVASVFIPKVVCVNKKTHKLVKPTEALELLDLSLNEKFQKVNQNIAQWASSEQLLFKDLQKEFETTPIKKKQAKKIN
ncbi:hypothetical protein M0813_24120 [Anaeramoeba flamelloides]|uniref:Thioesterase n=1 Tax=Anaeramoeba flamelloides TaxID=1746091 RepID=A0ABQ8Y8C3_9EUKA|nr:hypothetical protein M0813_24120 [Anaeramoeba flamelloides]